MFRLSRALFSASRTAVASPNAPKAIGPYSQAIKVNGVVYVSGCLGLDPKTGEFAGADVKAQTHMVFRNMAAVLKEAGCGMNDVVKSTVLLADMADFAAVNEIYAQNFSQPYPARSTFAVKTLPKNALVEIEAIAVVSK